MVIFQCYAMFVYQRYLLIVVTFQILRHFPLNHEWRKSRLKAFMKYAWQMMHPKYRMIEVYRQGYSFNRKMICRNNMWTQIHVFYPRYPNIFWEDVLYFGGPHTLSAGVWMCRLIGALKFYLFSPRFVLKKLPAWGLLLYGSFVWGPWKDGRVKLDDRNGRRDSQGWVTYSL